MAGRYCGDKSIPGQASSLAARFRALSGIVQSAHPSVIPFRPQRSVVRPDIGATGIRETHTRSQNVSAPTSPDCTFIFFRTLRVCVCPGLLIILSYSGNCTTFPNSCHSAGPASPAGPLQSRLSGKIHSFGHVPRHRIRTRLGA